MRKIAFLTGILAMAAAFAVPVVYRNPLDARSWAVAFDRSAPLAWHWADGAVSATLTFSNIVTRQTASTTVERGASFDGSCALPSIVPVQGQSAVDVTLSQTDGTAVIDARTVRLAVGSSATVFPDASSRSFRKVSSPRLYSWSDAWAAASEGAASATLSTSVKDGAAIGSWTLPAVGGYGVLSPKVSFGGVKGEVSAALSFDGTGFWTCDLLLENLGTAFIIR